MKLNWNFLGGCGGAKQKPSVGGVWIFSGTTHYVFVPPPTPCASFRVL